MKSIIPSCFIQMFSGLLLIFSPCFSISLIGQPKNQDNVIGKIRTLMFAGELEKAKSFCQKNIEQHPAWSPAYEYMGLILNKEKDYKQSLHFLEKAMQHSNKGNLGLSFNLGMAYFQMASKDTEYFRKALEYLEPVAQKNLLSEGNYLELGNCYAYLFHQDGGYINWERAINSFIRSGADSTLALIEQLPIKGFNPANGMTYKYNYVTGKIESTKNVDDLMVDYGLKYNGIYVSEEDGKFHYIRFDYDGILVTLGWTETYNVYQMASWLNRHNEGQVRSILVGKVEFVNPDSIRPVKYINKWPRDGEIRILNVSSDGLRLQAEQKIILSKGTQTHVREYKFQPLGKQGCVEGNCLNGEGTYVYKDGEVYKGSFKDGKAFGYGVFTRGSSYRYEGNYENGKHHGYGIETDEIGNFGMGSKYKGYWNYGEFCCEYPCEKCEHDQKVMDERTKRGHKILEGSAYVFCNSDKFENINITDGGGHLLGSNVCDEDYYVEVTDQDGKRKTSADPFDDNIDIFGFSYPITVEITYRDDCYADKTKRIVVLITEKGSWDIDIPLF